MSETEEMYLFDPVFGVIVPLCGAAEAAPADTDRPPRRTPARSGPLAGLAALLRKPEPIRR
jgi:hypothetical protein